MAQQSQPLYEFHYQQVDLIKTESLGIGSYGAVCKAMCDDLPCAAKILHPALFQFTTPGSTSVMQKFEQECRLLSAIKHPHIVQFLGMYHDPESRLPVLLMELMDESLTRFLARSHEPIPYHTEVNLCYDIALALSYLHSNGIIHRDLSSNNVLLIAGSRAKVTDFGMVKLYTANCSTAQLTPLTLCPGTMAYMSPEALAEPPVYTNKLDSFSFGVLAIQIMTRKFPEPGDRFHIIEISDPRAPSGRVKVDIPEAERRRSHIDLIDPVHLMLPLALNCLQDKDRDRPSSHELCGHISALKASSKYADSVRQSPVCTKPTERSNREHEETEVQQAQQIQNLQKQLTIQNDKLKSQSDKLLTQSDNLQAKEQKIQQQQQDILRLQNQLTETNDQLRILKQQLTAQSAHLHIQSDQLQGKEQDLQQRPQQMLGQQNLVSSTDDHFQKLTAKDEQQVSEVQQLLQNKAAISTCQQESREFTQQLQSNVEVTAKFQQNILEGEKPVQDQQIQVQELRRQLRQTESQKPEASGATASVDNIELRWSDEGRAPCEMWGGVATVDGYVAYFRCAPVEKEVPVYSLDFTSQKWSALPRCPNYGFSLAIVNTLLTAIGGKMPNHKVSSSLLSLTDNEWTERFLPMPTKRWVTTTVCSGRYLVVAGGWGEGGKRLSTVEMMDTNTRQWFTASSLPHPLSEASATLCGDQVYILAGVHEKGKSKSVFTCSLNALFQSCQSQSFRTRLRALSSPSRGRAGVWLKLLDTPVTLSTCASLHGQLVAVGGRDSDDKKTAIIHMYKTTTNSWVPISRITTARSQCLLAVFPQNQLMVVGGHTPDNADNSIEVATIVWLSYIHALTWVRCPHSIFWL